MTGLGEGDRVAVITGGTAGVGRATARAFSEHGFDVAVLARGKAGLRGAANDLVQSGRRALALQVDVGRFDEVDYAVKRIEDELGRIDVWVNNAMTTVFAPAWETDPADFQRGVEVTFLGQVWGTLAALRTMRARNAGTIVNVGSALAFVAIPLQASYCASKFACRGFTESVRAELIHEGSNVRVVMVHLPGLNTPQFGWCRTVFDRHPQPVPPVYQPEVAAAHIVRAALNPRRDITVGAWNKLLVAAGSLFPRFANEYAALDAWEGQLSDIPIPRDRPANLYRPVDDEEDMGPQGVFGGQARGIADPRFVASLPKTAKELARAAVRALVRRS